MKKIVYYEDPTSDDFALNNIKAKPVSDHFPFAIHHPAWNLLEFVAYRVIATPIVWLIAKVGFGLKVKNRKVLRKLHGTGFYLYGNHTNGVMDAYAPSLALFPRHVHIITGPEPVSVPVLRTAVQLVGGIPLPGSVGGFRSFMSALRLRISQKRVLTIYPEAHIWPWYTGIRPFPDSSFIYPLHDQVPVVACVTTYRQRRIFKNLWPCVTVTLSEPFYPDASLPPCDAKKKLRDDVYHFMCSIASNSQNYAYWEYRKKENQAA